MEKVKAALVQFRKSLGYADGVLDKMWDMMMTRTSSNYEDPDRLEYEHQLETDLLFCLRPLGTQLAIILEMLNLPQTRADFLLEWSSFDDKTLSEVLEIHDDNGDIVLSKPLSLCRRIMEVIEAPFESDIAGTERGALEILDFILSSTDRIVSATCPSPKCETDIQKVMYLHLSTTFPSFTPKVTISKPIMSFKPDCGIVDLGAAIEFKFVCSPSEFNVAIHGLNEDLSVYAGSLDWTRFYSVVYQTGPFGSEKQLRHALRKSGNAEHWNVHLVTGPGARSKGTQKKNLNGSKKTITKGKMNNSPKNNKSVILD